MTNPNEPSSFDDIITIAGERQEELNKLRYEADKFPAFMSKLREDTEWFRKTEQNVRNDPEQNYTRIEKLILSIMNNAFRSELDAYEYAFELLAENESLKDKYEPVS